MVAISKPHFTIKNKPQKGGYLYSSVLTPNILKDVCRRITGQDDYTVEFDNNGYNKGRLAIIEYKGTITYISFSEKGMIKGRNYFFQSITTALVRYYQENNTNKRICFYFLQTSGNIETEYFRFMYRLMVTAGFEFINSSEYLRYAIQPFTAIDDIITARYTNRGRNKGNNSTYITRSSNGRTEIYGKTYGASKKETSLLCIVASRVVQKQKLFLYEICEQNLSELPKPDLDVIKRLNNVIIIPTNMTMERKEYIENNSLRSPRYIYNLLEKLGPKKCAFCDCEIPELIEGAHIWPVSDIKHESRTSVKAQIEFATDGDNGLWLCDNHHCLLDENMIRISENGKLKFKSDLEYNSIRFIKFITPIAQLSNTILTEKFTKYLKRRNNPIEENRYRPIHI